MPTTLLLLFAVSGGGAPDAGPVAGLIRQLGDDDFDRREAASRELERLGESVRAAVEAAAARGEDAEVRQRAAAVVRALDALRTRREGRALHGTWEMVRTEVNGQKASGPDPTYLFVFDGERWKITLAGRLSQGGTIERIAPLEKRHAIDLPITEGGNAGATAYSIYRIEGDTLHYLNGPPPYAADFTTRPGDGRTYTVFRRAKPAP